MQGSNSSNPELTLTTRWSHREVLTKDKLAFDSVQDEELDTTKTKTMSQTCRVIHESPLFAQATYRHTHTLTRHQQKPPTVPRKARSTTWENSSDPSFRSNSLLKDFLLSQFSVQGPELCGLSSVNPDKLSISLTVQGFLCCHSFQFNVQSCVACLSSVNPGKLSKIISLTVQGLLLSHFSVQCPELCGLSVVSVNPGKLSISLTVQGLLFSQFSVQGPELCSLSSVNPGKLSIPLTVQGFLL